MWGSTQCDPLSQSLCAFCKREKKWHCHFADPTSGSIKFSKLRGHSFIVRVDLYVALKSTRINYIAQIETKCLFDS